ncbi:MAG: DUF1127 domain-containing protein [Pseudomonadota bacterium]
MAYAANVHSNTSSSIWSGVTGFFSMVGQAMVVSSSGDARMRKVEKLNAMSDAELAAINLRREDIAAYVFRDLMHI